MIIQHLPNLPDASIAHARLKQIHAEFSTIATKRGWNICSVTELCCCGDGIDHICSGSHLKRRKRRKMPDNVWGYNLSRSRKQFEIHIRLRSPKTHEILPYDGIAQTMAHEMAHCVYGAHSANFYELMDDISRQHNTFVKKGVVLDKNGFPVGSDKVYRLGSVGNNASNVNTSSYRTNNSLRSKKALDKQRKSRSRLLTGHVLGGGNVTKSTASKASSTRIVSLREAARIAAEKRRMEDSKWCLTHQELIEILDNDDICENENNEISMGDNVNQISKKSDSLSESSHVIIDLTINDETNQIDSSNSKRKLNTASAQNKAFKSFTIAHASPSMIPKSNHGQKSKTWFCKVCTFENTSLPNESNQWTLKIPYCSICTTPKVTEQENLEIIRNILREEDSKQICSDEEKRSKEQFGGFNIYGEKRTASSTMKHLT